MKEEGETMGKVIAISTQKGGVGKTSMTVNIGGVLAKEGYRVLIIDTDTQGHVSRSFKSLDANTLNYSLWDVLIEGLVANAAIINVYENIDILPCNKEMRLFEWRVWTKIEEIGNPFSLLKKNCEFLKEEYDYILLDTPPNLGLLQANALAFSDEVLIPFQPEPYSVDAIIEMIEVIDEARKNTNPQLKILGVVAMLVQKGTNLHANILDDLGKYCFENGIRKFETYIPRSIRYPKSIAEEEYPTVLTNKENIKDIKANYYDLVKEILATDE